MNTALAASVSSLDGPPPPALGAVLDFMRLVWEMDHALQKASKRMERALGVTGPQRLVIRIVGRFPGIPAGELATLLHVHPSTLTGILKRLERRSLLHRRVDARDGRRFLLSLTDQGRAVDLDTKGTVEAAVERALGDATPAEVAAATELLTSIGRSLASVATASGIT